MRRTLMMAAAGVLLMGAAPPDRPISYQVSSWGHLVEVWRIQPDGSIISSVSDGNGGPEANGKMITMATPPSPARYRWLAKVLAPASTWAGKPLGCPVTVTDAPYGEVRWGDGPALRFNDGVTCSAARTRAVMQSLQVADRQIDVWVKKDGKAAPDVVLPKSD